MSLEARRSASGDIITIRDSDDPDGIVQFTRADWVEWIGRIKNDIPCFEKVNAFEIPQGPKGDFTVLFKQIHTPWTDTELFLTEPELDATCAAAKSGNLDPEQLTENWFTVLAQ
jgi:hypothetical protein